jgi:hypothetical protein
MEVLILGFENRLQRKMFTPKGEKVTQAEGN